jgi:hypothetical protein
VSMATESLLNVRLDAEDSRRADDLKRAGVQLSTLVRQAIRSEHQRRIGGRHARRRAAQVMAEIYAASPDPPGLSKRSYDVHDSEQARRAIRKKLRVRRG